MFDATLRYSLAKDLRDYASVLEVLTVKGFSGTTALHALRQACLLDCLGGKRNDTLEKFCFFSILAFRI